MIRVPLSTLVFIYLFLFLGIVFTIWIVHELRKKGRENKLLRNWLRCSVCGMEFEAEAGDALPRCPRCGSLNERFRVSRL